MSYYQPQQFLPCAMIQCLAGAMVSFVNDYGLIKINYVVKSPCMFSVGALSNSVLYS